MAALTLFGIFHTTVSVVGLGSGVAAIVKHGAIDLDSRLGRTSLVTTAVGAVTGLGIFHHGGFGPPHVLSIITIVALAVGLLAYRTNVFGRASLSVGTVAFSATILCHLIPALTETTTRLPASSPIFSSPDAPFLKAANAVLLVTFVVGVILQLRLRGTRSSRGRLQQAARA